MTDVSGGAGHQPDEPQPTVKEGIAPKVLARRVPARGCRKAPRAHVHGGATHLTYTCEQMLHRNCAAINEGRTGQEHAFAMKCADVRLYGALKVKR
jgi:hypothetical protein